MDLTNRIYNLLDRADIPRKDVKIGDFNSKYPIFVDENKLYVSPHFTSKLSNPEMMAALLHERQHIKNKDVNNLRDILEERSQNPLYVHAKTFDNYRTKLLERRADRMAIKEGLLNELLNSEDELFGPDFKYSGSDLDYKRPYFSYDTRRDDMKSAQRKWSLFPALKQGGVQVGNNEQ